MDRIKVMDRIKIVARYPLQLLCVRGHQRQEKREERHSISTSSGTPLLRKRT